MFLAVLACAALTVSCSGDKKVTKGNPKKLDTLSYCIGAEIGMNIKQQLAFLDVNFAEVKKGVKGGLTDKADLTSDEISEMLQTFFSETLSERRAEFEDKFAQDSTLVFKPFASEAECEEISYALGADMGTNLRESGFPLQWYWVLEAFQSAQDDDLKLTFEEMQQFAQHYFTVTVPAEAAERSAKWLEKKARATGVKKTESGLLYKVIEEGDMSRAAKNDGDTVQVHYVGKLQDGEVFDASRFELRSEKQQEMMRKNYPSMFDENGNWIEEQKPIEFPLNAVIKGWTEGMKLVGPGGKIKLYIPAELAYGERGAGRNIGPNEALEFEVELIDVKPVAVEETPAVEEAAPAVETPAAK